MGNTTGDKAEPPGAPLSVLLTREVRWFHDGPVPGAVVAWFSSLGGDGMSEHRIDTYDVLSTRRGIGMKRRNHETIDVKFPMRRTEARELAPGIVGRVEDWVKITVGDTGAVDMPDGLDIEKHIVTYRYPLPRHPDAGCEVELATIMAGSRTAWTIAVETLGPPVFLDESFDTGIAGLLAGPPPPAGVHFDDARSCGYPVWVNQLVQIS